MDNEVECFCLPHSSVEEKSTNKASPTARALFAITFLWESAHTSLHAANIHKIVGKIHSTKTDEDEHIFNKNIG